MASGLLAKIRQSGAPRLLRDLGRGMVGALLLGVPFVYTMETWWLGWILPMQHIIGFVLIGLALVFFVIRQVGFKEEEKHRFPGLKPLVADFFELFLQSVLAAFAALFVLGVIGLDESLSAFVRGGILHVVPLGLGAAVANRALRAAPAEGGGGEDVTRFSHELAVFTMGALFFALPIAPTEEIPLLASRMGWLRSAALLLVAFGLTHMTLYLLEFRGHRGRLGRLNSNRLRLGETAIVFTLALATSAALLWGFGHFRQDSFDVWVQEIIVLVLPASLGGSAAQVVF